MRPLILFSLVLATALTAQTADLVINVTPQNLVGWTVAGADRGALTSANQLVLPAGAQMSQTFSGGTVILHLVSRQAFSDQPNNWPIIGLGSAAVALIRKDGQGKLVLVVNETTATNLPWTVPLDPNNSQDQVELTLAYDPPSGVGLISYEDQVVPFNLSPSTKPAEVWLSAGANSNWPLDVLQVVVLGANPDTASTAGSLGTSNTSATTPTTVAGLQATLDKLRSTGGVTGATGQTAASKANSVGTDSRLEVYTPPSVRRMQVLNAVRSTIAQAQAK